MGLFHLKIHRQVAIFDNYDALRDYQFYIVGEQILFISQHLLGIKGSCKEVSHMFIHILKDINLLSF